MERFIGKKIETNYDVIIIGGGITGACVAYEAASQGLKVALFEKNDFSAATSSATTKLIHGGLRYLKNLEFGLVRESLMERRILENIAPNFVYPLPFMVPTYKTFKSNKQVLLTGMLLYDVLSFDKGFTKDKSKKLPHFKMLSAKKVKSEEECVKEKGLTGASVYYDCQNIFPERLSLAFIKSAVKYGADVANYAKVTSFIHENNSVKGVKVKDLISEKEHDVIAPITINCAGPWVDIVLNSASSNENYHIQRSEGIHIITEKACNKHAVTVMTKDGRHIMLIPWRNHSLIGTTDKEYNGNPDDYKLTKKSIEELINDVNENYNINLKYEDVKFSYGGLRPLVDDQTKGSYETSRKYEIFDNAKDKLDGLITVEGGKYTTSRQLAINVQKLINKKLSRKRKKSITKNEFLVGSEIPDIEKFIAELNDEYKDFSKETINYLGKNYGTECHKIFNLARANKNLAHVVSGDGEILAEVEYAVKNEMAFTLSDIMFRRTGIGTLGYPGKEIFDELVNYASELLKWDEKRKNNEIDTVMQLLELPKK